MKLSIFIVCLLSFISANAQDLTPLEIAKKTIAASGGETWRRPRTLQLSGTATLYFNGETYRMTEYKMWRIFPSESDSAHTANGKIRFDAREENGKTFMQLIFDGTKSAEILSDAAKQNQQFLRLSNNFGFSIFRFVENPEFKLTRLPDDKIDGNPCYFFKITDAKKSDTIFAVDRKTFLIRYAAFQSALGLQQRYYDDFKQVKGTKFMQPRSLRIYNNGFKTTEVFWSSYKINQPIEDKVFEIK
jgi:outer membrane lipoprotein-sorting protein